MNAPSSSASHAPVAITQGDPAGIGGEIIAKAFLNSPQCTAGCFVVGDLSHMVRASRVCALPGQVPLSVAVIEEPAEAAGVPPNCIPLLQVSAGPAMVDWGKVDASAGRMAADAVVWAARAALRGEVSALVTAPLHKEALSAAGVLFPGHTELLQAEAAGHLRTSVEHLPVRMMLANDELRTVLVSIHVPLRQAIEAVTADNVLQTIRITHRALSRMLGRKPRIAVAGLNPHAGENGLFGSEERLSIAVERGRAYLAAGADIVFVPGVRDPALVRRLADGIGGPLSLMVGPGAPPAAELFAAGARRISLGPHTMLAALGTLRA
ncbi:MAG: 4-hydroxythreonine-4-phosphate dehydrogenase, partial [uncultured Ramlibacter sp.]